MKLFCMMLVFPAVLAISVSGYAQGIPARAFKNVTIHQSNGNVIKDGVIVWRNGRIESVGKDNKIPFDAEVWDGGDSLHVYPGFIDGNAYWGSPDRKNFDSTPKHRGDPGYKRAGIRPDRHASDAVKMDSDDFKTAMKTGFTTAALATEGYMIPGQLDLFFLQPELNIGNVYEAGVGMQLQFQRSNRVFPSTVMGIMAELEQLFLNAKAMKQRNEYHEEHPREISAAENDPILEELYPVMDKKQPFFFKVDSKEMIERVFKLQDRLDFDVVIVSGMEAYKVADELKQRNIPVLASINFPDQPEWKTKDYKEKGNVTDEMKKFREKRWEAYQKRYTNIKKLLDAGVDVGFASADLKLKDMDKRMKQWKENGGLSDDQMLQILTTNTADILNKRQALGDLQQGEVASFAIMTKPFLAEKTKTVYAVSNGILNELNED